MIRKFNPQRMRDPLHDLIEFSPTQFENDMWEVINTRPFQRLRRIRQLGFSDLTFPGATHSRFAHSVGVFHIARLLMKIIEDYLRKNDHFQEPKAQLALAGALVHDVGHGPFSHSFEEVGERLNLKMADHEKVSEALIRDSEISRKLEPLGSGFASDVADLIKGRGEKHIYGSVVSSQFDADRLDYMQRDRLMTGTQHGAIDFTWLLANLKIGTIPITEDDNQIGEVETFVLGPKAKHAAESYVLGLFQLYPTVYYHKTTRGAEKLFTELLVQVIQLIQNGDLQKTALPDNHPLAKLALDPDNIECMLDLDDTVIWGALSLLADAPDSVVGELGSRLRDRQLYKAINIRGRVKKSLLMERKKDIDEDASEDATLIDGACASIQIKIDEWLNQHKNILPRILVDKGERSPYKDFQVSKGPLNQIYIELEDGDLVDIKERSEVVKAIEVFKFFRVYLSGDDNEAISFIEKVIEEEAANVRKKSA